MNLTVHFTADTTRAPDLSTSNPETIAIVRKALEAAAPFKSDTHLVPAHDLANILAPLQPDWADELMGYEEAHCVTVRVE